MKPLVPPTFLPEPFVRSRQVHQRLRQLFQGEQFQFGLVSTPLEEGEPSTWKDVVAWPDHDLADFPPETGAHYRVLIPGPNFPGDKDDYTTEPALVIGMEFENGQRIFLLRLQTTIVPNPLRSEAIHA